MKFKNSKYKSMLEWSHVDPRAYVAAKAMGILKELGEAFGWTAWENNSDELERCKTMNMPIPRKGGYIDEHGMQGNWTIYANGIRESQGYYINDKAEGWHTFYTNDGKKRHCNMKFTNGVYVDREYF